RHLPTLTEAIAIILFVDVARLQTDQKTMIKSALIDGSFYGLYSASIAIIIIIGSIGILINTIDFYKIYYEILLLERRMASVIIAVCVPTLSLTLIYILYRMCSRSSSRLNRGFLAAKK